MSEISVHQDDEFTGALLHAVNVGTSKTHFAGSSVQHNFSRIDFLKLSYNILSSIGRVVINNHDFHIDVPSSVQNKGGLTIAGILS